MNREKKSIIEQEKRIYLSGVDKYKDYFLLKYMHDERYEIFRFMKELRLADYYAHLRDRKKSFVSKLLCIRHSRRMSLFGNRLGFFISPDSLGKNVVIYHKGSIIINQKSIIGDGCKFHGDNCIGNKGFDEACPVLGKNVNVGIGAKIIGGVTIADDIVIGANAVVTKSFSEPGITIAGVPAKRIK